MSSPFIADLIFYVLVIVVVLIACMGLGVIYLAWSNSRRNNRQATRPAVRKDEAA